MAEAFKENDLMTCSICLDLLKDPVTTACGHSYCMGCIKESWDQDDRKGVYSCPQCRQTFTPRPVLGKNTLLNELVEKLKTGLQAAPPAYCYAGPSDVGCDICAGRKLKAVKSCLLCLASYCETHLKLHNHLNQGKKHKLIDATGLQEKICSRHDKLLEVYCRTDQQCICLLCVMDDHKGHDIVPAAEERTEKQKQLGENSLKSQQRIQEREKEMQELRQAVDTLKRSAQVELFDSERTLTELIHSIEKGRSEVKELISAQEKAQVGRAKRHLKQLEQEVAGLRRRDAELKHLSHTQDHIHFLQHFQSLCVPLGSEGTPSIIVTFKHVKKFAAELQERLQDLCKVQMDRIYGKVAKVPNVHLSEPKTREEFLEWGKMSSFPASASKSFSSTPLKTYQDSGRELHRSKSVDYDSTGDSTYSLLSPIYHDSYESDEDVAAAHHVHQIDTSATQSDDARPLSPIRVEHVCFRYDPQQKPPERRAVTEAADPEASLSAWERWLVCKAKEERLRIEKKAEEERLLRERNEEQEREQQKKKIVVEQKIQEWLQMKKEQEKQEKLLKESKEQEEMQRQQQKQRVIEQKAEEKYREWLRRKNLEKMERERRAKEEAACREAQERERRQRAEENFKEWLRAQDKSRPSPNAPGCPRGGYDNVTYPSPSFYNPIPWKPIHVPPPDKPPVKKTSRRKQPSQPKYQNSPSIPFRLRDTVSSAARLQRR